MDRQDKTGKENRKVGPIAFNERNFAKNKVFGTVMDGLPQETEVAGSYSNRLGCDSRLKRPALTNLDASSSLDNADCVTKLHINKIYQLLQGNSAGSRRKMIRPGHFDDNTEDEFLLKAESLTAEERLQRRDKFEESFKEGYVAMKKGLYRHAIDCYKEALKISSNNPSLTLDNTQIVTTIEYALNFVKVESNNFEKIVQAIEFVNDHQHFAEVFPAFYYLLGKAYIKLNRFKHALEALEKCMFACQYKVFHPQFWPHTDECIKESTKDGLEEAVNDLIELCHASPKPTAVCRYVKCLETSNHIVPSKCIYVSDPDFIGYVKVACDEAVPCMIQYHVQCWKAFKECYSNCTKVNDKDMLHQMCPTTDCVNADGSQSRITRITIFGQNNTVKAEVRSDSVTTDKPAVQTGAKKKQVKQREEKSPDKAPRLPAKVKLRRPKLEKGKADVHPEPPCEPSVSSAVRSEESLKPFLHLLDQLRDINFGREDSVIWDPRKNCYGRKEEESKCELKIFDPRSTAKSDSKNTTDKYKEFVFSWFYEVLLKEGPIKVYEIEEQWESGANDRENMFYEVKMILPHFTKVCDLLLESTLFCVIDDTVCLSIHLEEAYESAKIELTESIAFMLEDNQKHIMPPPQLLQQRSSPKTLSNDENQDRQIENNEEEIVKEVEERNLEEAAHDENNAEYDIHHDTFDDSKGIYYSDDEPLLTDKSNQENEFIQAKENADFNEVVTKKEDRVTEIQEEPCVISAANTESFTDNTLIASENISTLEMANGVEPYPLDTCSETKLQLCIEKPAQVGTNSTLLKHLENSLLEMKSALNKTSKEHEALKEGRKQAEADKAAIVNHYESRLSLMEARHEQEKLQIEQKMKTSKRDFDNVYKKLNELLNKLRSKSEEMFKLQKTNREMEIKLLETEVYYNNIIINIVEPLCAKEVATLEYLAKFNSIASSKKMTDSVLNWTQLKDRCTEGKEHLSVLENHIKDVTASEARPVEPDLTSLLRMVKWNELIPSSVRIETLVDQLVQLKSSLEPPVTVTVTQPNDVGPSADSQALTDNDNNNEPLTFFYDGQMKDVITNDDDKRSHRSRKTSATSVCSEWDVASMKDQPQAEGGKKKKKKNKKKRQEEQQASVPQEEETGVSGGDGVHAATSCDSTAQTPLHVLVPTHLAVDVPLLSPVCVKPMSATPSRAKRDQTPCRSPIPPLISPPTRTFVSPLEMDSKEGSWQKCVDRRAHREPAMSVVPMLTTRTKTKSQYVTLLNRLQEKHPTKTEKEIRDCIKVVRENNNSSLSGLKIDEIFYKVGRLFADKLKKTGTMGLEKFGETAWGGAAKPCKMQKPIIAEECVICCEDIGRVNITVLECKHSYHTECLRMWLKEKSVCPLCNKFCKLLDEFPAL